MARNSLSQDGFVALTAAALANCDLERVGLGVGEAVDGLEQLFSGFEGVADREQALRGIFVRGQNALMAYRRDDFLTIQQEAPFNDSALNELNRYFEVWAQGGPEELRRQYELSLALLFTGRKDFSPASPIRILGGNGSVSDPIMFSAPDLRKRVRAENWYVNYEFGLFPEDWDETSHMTVFNGETGKQISLWNIQLKDGSERAVHFDTTLYG